MKCVQPPLVFIYVSILLPPSLPPPTSVLLLHRILPHIGVCKGSWSHCGTHHYMEHRQRHTKASVNYKYTCSACIHTYIRQGVRFSRSKGLYNFLCLTCFVFCVCVHVCVSGIWKCGLCNASHSLFKIIHINSLHA